jgi:chromate transporter
VLVGLMLWWVPVFGIRAWLGPEHAVTQQGFFFSKTALVTFGGAYSVLPYVADRSVNDFGWLTPPQMMDGLALAETTPGPLIMVLQFVGFVGAWQHPATLAPIASATLGAALTTWVTFVPCFLFIFAGAPYIERLRRVKVLSAALGAVTAAVVGVILNLALWFGWHLVVRVGKPFDWFALVLAVGAFVAMKRFNAGMFTVIAVCALAGILRSLIPGL